MRNYLIKRKYAWDRREYALEDGYRNEVVDKKVNKNAKHRKTEELDERVIQPRSLQAVRPRIDAISARDEDKVTNWNGKEQNSFTCPKDSGPLATKISKKKTADNPTYDNQNEEKQETFSFRIHGKLPSLTVRNSTSITAAQRRVTIRQSFIWPTNNLARCPPCTFH